MKKPAKVAPEVKITKDGPYLVSGNLLLATEVIGMNNDGESIKWEAGAKYPAQTNCALCRCGQSANSPFCDGSHTRVAFDGSETASRAAYLDQAKVIKGPTMSLTDAEGRHFARALTVVGRFHAWDLRCRWFRSLRALAPPDRAQLTKSRQLFASWQRRERLLPWS